MNAEVSLTNACNLTVQHNREKIHVSDVLIGKRESCIYMTKVQFWRVESFFLLRSRCILASSKNDDA